MLWLIFWTLAMLGLVVATVVVAMREKKARTKALKEMQPQPIDPELDPGMDPMGGDPLAADDGFGEPVDQFGDEAADDFSELDENAVQ